MPSCALTEIRGNPQLETVLAAYLQAEESCEANNPHDWLMRYPDLVDELKEFFDSRDQVPRIWSNQPRLITPCRFGNYELLEEIAHGGMGIVYKARQLRPNRIVALKLILSGQLARRIDVDRFHAEAQAAASLDHPHIVPIYEVGQQAGQHYFTMKLIEGGSLSARAQDGRGAAGLVATVARAVHYAHQRGILHRDLKPANILLDSSGQPYVSDFGLAKQFNTDDTATLSGAIVGTASYMAPEQAAGCKSLTTAADIYSLGAILYELLTQRPPFKAESSLQTLLLVRDHDPAPPRSINPQIDRDLETICLKCLEKDPARRYGSAEQLADDLDRWLAGDTILARPATRLEQTLRRCRRHPLVSALSAALVVVAALGLFGILSQWQLALANEQKANDSAAQAQEQAEVANQQRDEVKALADRLHRTLYAAHMNLAHNAWVAGNVGRVNDLLEQHHPKPGENDLRGFEWHYLYRLSHTELLTFQGGSPDYSPDGKRLAIFEGKTATVKDVQSGRVLATYQGHTDGVESLTFSPDGKRIASWGGIYRDEKPRGELKVWDAHTGQELLDCMGHTDWIMCTTFSPDGKRLATASLDNTVKTWDAQTGQELFTITKRTTMAYDVAFSPDGKRLAGAGQDGATVWDAQTGEELLTPKGGSWSVAYSPDGNRLASGKTVFDAQTGEILFALEGDGEFKNFSPDGNRLAGPGGARTVKVWDAHTGQELFTFKGHTNRVGSVKFHRDGTRLISSSHGGNVKVWDVTARPNAGADQGFGKNIVYLAFSPDGKRLVTGTGTWKSAELATFVAETKVWDSENGRELIALKGPAHVPVFSPDGKRIAGAGSGAVRLWNAQTGQELLALKGHEGVYCVTFSPDGNHLASAADDGTVKVWDAESGQERFTLKLHTAAVWSVAFSPDGKRLATNSRDGMVKVWDAQTGQELLSIQRRSGGKNEHTSNVAFSPDGKRLASCINRGPSGDGEIKVWDAQSGEEVLSLKGHTFSVSSVAFSPDGKRLLSGSGDFSESGEVKVWDAQTGQELLTIQGGAFNHRIAISPDGHRLASNAGGVVRIYDATPLPEKP